jgi:uncharacterized protein (TIGR02598 family)
MIPDPLTLSRPRVQPRRFGRGFSLVETVVALGIASSCLLTLVALIPSGLDQVRQGERETATARVLQFVNTEYQMRPWADVLEQELGGGGEEFYFDHQGTQVSLNDKLAVYGVRVQVFPAPLLPGAANPNPSLRSLHLSVSEKIKNRDPFRPGPGVRQHNLQVTYAE